MDGLNRRRVLTAGAALGAAALGAPLAGVAGAAGANRGPRVPEDTRTLDELHQQALAEGGELVVYAGGDIPGQQDRARQAFLSRFPGMRLTMVVDYSKFHDVRVDNQLATGTLVPDVVQLQTVQDFVRWKRQGVLQAYKPAGSSRIHERFKDPDGAWTALSVLAFSYLYDVAATGADAPGSPAELISPRWRGRIASSYPHDDDASLYLYKLYTEAYGRSWLAGMAAQEIQFARGSHTPRVAVDARQKEVGVGTAGSLTAPATAPVRWAVPDGHPFVAWGQRAAILVGARHPAAARLYLSWAVSPGVQQGSFNGWSVRTDVTPPSGLRPIWAYPNAHLDGFVRFMADRAEAERWRQTFALYFGEVVGEPTAGRLGLHPGR
ncbi:MAG TPA: ABC transporter substrate-binding protein [Catenuloplanes sp.]|jgi:ABC-type Fe3+ transport system substrate-binding protein